jgi:hypothetical protein
VKKQRGRPIKPATGKRTQVTTLIRADLKRRLMEDAKQSGRTLSQEIEHWLERLLAYETLTSAFANLQPTEDQGLRDLQKVFASLVPSAPRAVSPGGPPSPRAVRPGGPEDDEDSKT